MSTTTELVFSHFKPDVAEEGFNVMKVATRGLDAAPGLLARRYGHILRHNNADVANKYGAVLGIEWDKPSSFHALFPGSDIFKQMISSVIPYAVQKATPVLFQAPNNDKKRSNVALGSGVTQILALPAGNADALISAKGQKYIEVAKHQKGFIDAWTGVGIEDANISWVAIVGWDNAENLDAAVRNGAVGEALKDVTEVGAVEEYLVRFNA